MHMAGPRHHLDGMISYAVVNAQSLLIVLIGEIINQDLINWINNLVK